MDLGAEAGRHIRSAYPPRHGKPGTGHMCALVRPVQRPQPEAETAPPPQGGADELHQALEQALDRAKPPTPPSP